jgi:signal peptidase I
MEKKNIFLLLLVVVVITVSGCVSQSAPTSPILPSGTAQPLGQVVPSAPSIRISDSNIKTDYTYPQFYSITIGNAGTLTMATIDRTGSMIPTFNENSHVIYTKQFTKDDLKVGDITVYYNPNFYNADVIHRIVEKGTDENGLYFITKGDANKVNDPKIRFEMIKGVVMKANLGDNYENTKNSQM